MSIRSIRVRGNLGALSFALAAYCANVHATLTNGTADAALYGDVANEQFGGFATVKGDYNGDGFPDLVSGMPSYTNGESYEGAVYVYYGTANGFPDQPDMHYETDMLYGYLGSSPIAADINGDGYDDLVVGAYNYTGTANYQGAVMVFFGGPNGLSSTPDQIMTGESTYSYYGFGIRNMGDLNGDGYADVLVTAMGQGSVGKVYVYMGSAAGLNTTPASTLTGTRTYGYFGNMIATGDANGDGLFDVAITLSASDPDPAQVLIYHGTASGIEASPSQIVTQPEGDSSERFGNALLLPGDIDGDGHPDLVVGSPYYVDGATHAGKITVFFGSDGGDIATDNYQVVTSNSTDWTYFGDNLSAGDFDNDGHMDVVIGTSINTRPTSAGQPWPGIFWIMRGTSSGLASTPLYAVKGETGSLDQVGVTIAPGDINSDGVLDMVSGSGTYTYSLTSQGVLRTYLGAGVNHAPVAAKDTFKLQENAGYTALDVLSNDSDADGDTLTVKSIVQQPEYGNLQLLNGRLYYRPAKGFTGSDSFKYKVTDGHDASDKAKVVVKVKADQ